MIKTKSILSEINYTDGLRISIMSKHTLNDGVTPHPDITSYSFDIWLPILSPPLKLVGDYYKRGLSWESFEKRYLEHIRKDYVKKEVKLLAEKGLDSMITLLCIEEFPFLCHRSILAKECKLYQPSLELYIN